MLFLIDENVPQPVADFLEQRGHDVRSVRDILAGLDDTLIAFAGNEMGAIVVTADKDFEKIVPQVPKGDRRRFRKLGRISFRCPKPRARLRLETVIDVIESFHQRMQSLPSQPFIVEITDTTLVFRV